jgi:non-lysosomal glucosylceramidase
VRTRYNGGRRSPWNDVECGDHYARALSSWALLDAACGYQYDAATASLTVAPRLAQDDFRAFFITAEGWGSATLQREGGKCTVTLSVSWGTVRLRSLTIGCSDAASIIAQLGDEQLPCTLNAAEGAVEVRFDDEITIPAGAELTVEVSME